MSLASNDIGSNVCILKTDVAGGNDVHKDTASTVDGGLEKGRRNSHLSSLFSLILTCGITNTHVSVACILHNSGNVCEVKVDVTLFVNEVGNALYTCTENVVCNLKSVSESDSLIACLLELVVRNNDERVNELCKLFDTCRCVSCSYLTLKGEGTGNDTDSKNIHFTSNASDYGSRTCSCSTAHTCGNEYHVGVLEKRLNVLKRFLSCALTDLGLSARASTAGELFTDDELRGSVGMTESHSVGVDGDKFNALDVRRDHSVDSVISAAAYAYNLNIGAYFDGVIVFKNCHFVYPPIYIFLKFFYYKVHLCTLYIVSVFGSECICVHYIS